MPNLFLTTLMSQGAKKGYVQDGLIYQGVPLSATPTSVSFPNGEFTVEIAHEFAKQHDNASGYMTLFHMHQSTSSDGTNLFGNLRNDGLIGYLTEGDNWYFGNRPAGMNVIGDKRTMTFVFDKDNVKTFYYKSFGDYEHFTLQKQASKTFSRTDYDRVYCVSSGYYNYFNVRIYDRALTAQEIAHNYEIDKERYGI